MHCLRFAASVAILPMMTFAASRDTAETNIAGWPVRDTQGQLINYSREQLESVLQSANAVQITHLPEATPPGFAPATSTQQPFWAYSIFGSGIGASNIVIGPDPGNGTAREILIGGNSVDDFSADNFWHSIRHNPTSGNYEDVFVSPLYSGTIRRIALGNVIGDANLEIAVMLVNGTIYLYDFGTKAELGVLNTGVNGLVGLYLADLNSDGQAELIAVSANDLFVFNGAGALLWQVAGAGGSDVVAGQMDNDAALEIAATKGKVVDAATQVVQWNYTNGFGVKVRLAPFAGQTYQQLVVAQVWGSVDAYDVANQSPRWSIPTSQDIGGLRIADVDNDGTPEVIIGDGQSGSLHVYDLLTQAQKWSVSNPESGVTDVAVGDVDNDGVVDLLWGAGYSSSGPDYLYVAATTDSHSIKWQSLDLVGPFLGPVVGDLDGDGQLEMVVCSNFADAGSKSGRILVFDLATLTLRGISAPVMSNGAFTGVHDLKLRDVENDGRMEIVVAADFTYNGAIEVYGFDLSNTFTLKWTNTTRPSFSAFNKVDVADLDNNGTAEIVAGAGAYLYIFDYPSTAFSWQSVELAHGAVNGLVVQDVDRNGAKEFVALTSNDDLYTFDGPTRQLVDLVNEPNAKLLSSRPKPTNLILGDDFGAARFLQ